MINRILLLSIVALGFFTVANPVVAITQDAVPTREVERREKAEIKNSSAKKEVIEDIKLKKIILPKLQVNIPGISWEDTVVIGDDHNGCDSKNICVKTVDVYLNAFYKWSAGAATIVAIVLIMIGGVEYMIGSAAGTIDKAKKRITNAAMGLLILLSITAILSFIDPNITSMSPIKLQVVDLINQDLSDETKLGAKDDATTAVEMYDEDGNSILTTKFQTDYLKAYNVVIHPDIVKPMQDAALELFNETGMGISIASGGRATETQAKIWLERFGTRTLGEYSAKGHNAVCNPWPRTDETSPFTSNNHRSGPWTVDESILKEFSTKEELEPYLIQKAKENDKIGCPHVPGTAVDVWCNDDIGNRVDSVKCHLALERAMNSAGFKRISIEGWHFEYAGDGYTPMSESARYGQWTPGLVLVDNAKLALCKKTAPDRYSDDCVFDYSKCTSTYVNLAEFCCSDKQGTCCDGKTGGTPNSQECNPQ